jgi:hypothetical protein
MKRKSIHIAFSDALTFYIFIRGNFIQFSRICDQKRSQPKIFQRTSQNDSVSALFSSLIIQLVSFLNILGNSEI